MTPTPTVEAESREAALLREIAVAQAVLDEDDAQPSQRHMLSGNERNAAELDLARLLLEMGDIIIERLAAPSPATGVETGELASRLRAGLAEMASRASVPMDLWGLFSNDVLAAVEALASPPPAGAVSPTLDAQVADLARETIWDAHDLFRSRQHDNHTRASDLIHKLKAQILALFNGAGR